MAQLIAEEGLALDVVSGGELYTALKADFPPERIYFHGNNKSRAELDMALNAGVGVIILDHQQEFHVLAELAQARGVVPNVLLRINPGVEAHTHEYIRTTTNDSKFGLSIFDPDTTRFIRELAQSETVNFLGLHYHIGSQIFADNTYTEAARVVLDFVSVLRQQGVICHILNLGGGFGVYYTEDDRPLDFTTFLADYTKTVYEMAVARELPLPKLLIEPGRAIINSAGSTLYTVGGTKHTFAGRDYIFVDGGMSDNIRPALYQAKYEGHALPIVLMSRGSHMDDRREML